MLRKPRGEASTKRTGSHHEEHAVERTGGVDELGLR